MGGMMSCLALNFCECAGVMACSCMNGFIQATLAQATRFGHLLVFLATFALAIIIGQSSPEKINGYNYYTQIDLLSGCDSNYGDNCIYRQLIYRASFSLGLLFFALALMVIPSDYVNKSFWSQSLDLRLGCLLPFGGARINFSQVGRNSLVQSLFCG